jgi:hypothetical protein
MPLSRCLLVILITFFSITAVAQRSGGRSGTSRSSTSRSSKSGGTSKSSGVVHVRGYTRKDGTYVPGYDRTAPNDTKLDNWSTEGNINPETGKPGTKNPYPENRRSSAGVVDAAGSEDQRPMQNADVVQMINEGVELNEVKNIVTDARSDFDTCAAALRQLKSSGVTDDIILSMVASTLTESSSVESNAKPVQRSDVSAAKRGPQLQGLHLGMNFSNAAPILGRVVRLRDELGIQQFYVERYTAGVSSMEVEFLDGNLESINVSYDSSVRWSNEKEFLSTVAERLGLSNAWSGERSGSIHTIAGEGFRLDAEYNLGITPTLHLYDPTAQGVIRTRRTNQEEQKRQSFKP